LQAKKQLANNIDPFQAKKDAKIQAASASENTFKSLTLEWHEEESSWKCNGMVRMNKPSFIRSQEIETFSGQIERGGRYDIIACKRKRDILCHQNK